MTSSPHSYLPDTVRLSELHTAFSADPRFTTHFHIVAGPGRTRSRVEETWMRERELGSGTFGTVYLEECIQGSKKGQLRAVKKIQKSGDHRYIRELEAIALFSNEKFSHEMYDQSFVKSYGWFADNVNVFITLEYIPHGDLQKHLKSPLPECEAQDITFQVLEGLCFMHESGFAHRDLKPANILVVDRGPQWYVKITDFGISKRAIDGVTALRTLGAGTFAFMAPELRGFGPADDPDEFTNAIDIWSVGVITVLILTGEIIFRDPRHLNQYVNQRLDFPKELLANYSVGSIGCDFIRSLLIAAPRHRPEAKASLQHAWLSQVAKEKTVSFEDQLLDAQSLPTSDSSASRAFRQQKPKSLDHDPDPSASWSTQEQDSETSASNYPEAEHSHSWNAKVQYLDQTSSNVYKTASQVENATTARPRLVPRLIIPPIVQTQIDRKPIKALKGHRDSVHSVAFSSDGQLVVSGSSDGTVRLWNITTGREVKRLDGHSDYVRSVAFSPDGLLVISGSGDKTVRLWNITTGNEVKRLEGHSDYVRSVAFSPDGQLVISGSDDKTVRLWNTTTGKVVKRLRGHSNYVQSVAFSPDGQLVASGSDDRTVQLWETAIDHSARRAPK